MSRRRDCIEASQIKPGGPGVYVTQLADGPLGRPGVGKDAVASGLENEAVAARPRAQNNSIKWAVVRIQTLAADWA